MKRYSIKKVKFDGIVGTSLGYSQSYGIENNDVVLSAQGRMMVAEMMQSWEDDYKEYGDEIGKITAQYYFEENKLDLGRKSDGGIVYDGTNMGKNFYELVLKIFVPFNGIDMTDVHIYRFNVRKGEFEFEETETL